jgi:outer membrane murein-binding lipoprotein Lpp
MDARDEDRLDEAIARFGRLVRAIEQRQSRTESRLAGLYQLTFIAFILVVASIAFLTIILSQQVPEVSAAISTMNRQVARVADDMDRMERTVQGIGRDMGSLPVIMAEMDRMHASVGFMSSEVGAMAGSMTGMNTSVAAMQMNLTDMRQSFEVMEFNVGRMGSDVNQLSKPMRMFNWMNPLQ